MNLTNGEISANGNSIGTGAVPSAIAITPTIDALFVANSGSNSISAVHHQFVRCAHGSQRNDDCRNHTHGPGHRSRRQVFVRCQSGIEQRLGVFD